LPVAVFWFLGAADEPCDAVGHVVSEACRRMWWIA
jgi:hypothetical protein